MTDEELAALRDHLGREPSPMERVTWAQRQRNGTLGPTLEEYLRAKAEELLAMDWRDRANVVRHLEHDRDNLCVPANVATCLPMSEEGIRAAYDTVLDDVRDGEL